MHISELDWFNYWWLLLICGNLNGFCQIQDNSLVIFLFLKGKIYSDDWLWQFIWSANKSWSTNSSTADLFTRTGMCDTYTEIHFACVFSKSFLLTFVLGKFILFEIMNS